MKFRGRLTLILNCFWNLVLKCCMGESSSICSVCALNSVTRYQKKIKFENAFNYVALLFANILLNEIPVLQSFKSV